MWKDIKGFEKFYEVSDKGEVRNKQTNYTLKPCLKKTGYLSVCLFANGKKSHRSVHRLVAETFIPNPFNYPQVNHIDEDKTNNNLSNLEWCTAKYNVNYGKGYYSRFHKIIQYSLNGEVIQKWGSLKEASESLGVKYQGISQCLQGRRPTGYGFKWGYAE